jgi:hypothetical protein
MTLTIKKQQELQVEIDLPAFFRKSNSSYFAVFSENQIIQINDFGNINYLAMGQAHMHELANCEKITLAEFQWAFQSVVKKSTNFINHVSTLLKPIVDIYEDAKQDYAES